MTEAKTVQANLKVNGSNLALKNIPIGMLYLIIYCLESSCDISLLPTINHIDAGCGEEGGEEVFPVERFAQT